MGFFRKTKKVEGPDAIQAELAALRERLAATEQARADLEAQLRGLGDTNTELNARVSTLDQAHARIDSRLGALDHGFTKMGDQLNAIATTNTRLDQRLTAIDDLDARVSELTDRLDTPLATTPTPPSPPSSTPPPPPPATPMSAPVEAVDDERIDDMAAQLDVLANAVAAHTEQMSAARSRMDEIDELTVLFDAAEPGDATTSEQIATLREQLTDVAEQMTSMDGRVTAVSTELANQLTELSRDIDELNRRTQEAGGGESGEVIDTTELEARLAERLDTAIVDVLDTTEKLAAEQARYEIQFRADLAELAERLRRPGTS